MALAKSSLGFPIECGAGATTTVYSVSSSKKAYIRSIILYHNNVGSGSALAQIGHIYVVPNNGGSVGTATEGNAIARISLVPDDATFYEVQYPITLESNGDSIQVFNAGNTLYGTGSTNPITVLILGDKEE